MNKVTNIIIIEDERSFVMRFKLIMQKVGILMQGFKHFTNSEDAIRYYHQVQPEIVFLDINLKGSPRDGMEVFGVFEERRKSRGKDRDYQYFG